MIEGKRLNHSADKSAPGRTTLPPPFQGRQQPFRYCDSRRLRGPVPLHFEEFYRAHLRFIPGGRVKSSDIWRFYSAWADANGAPSLTMRAIKRAMVNIGHLAMKSNGVRYCDVSLAVECEHVADNYPSIPLPAEAQAAMIAEKIDALISELSGIRAQVVGAAHSH